MESSGSEDQAKESADMQCHLVWEGTTNLPQFGDKFRAIYGVKSETEGRKAFSEKTQYLWEAVLNFQPKRAIGLGEEDTIKA